jgi:hypothetical protein
MEILCVFLCPTPSLSIDPHEPSPTLCFIPCICSHNKLSVEAITFTSTYLPLRFHNLNFSCVSLCRSFRYSK